MRKLQSPERRAERGSVLLVMAVAMVVVIGFGAMVLDLGSALVTRAELQNVSDAGSIAGTRELAKIYGEKGAYTSYKDYTLTGSDKSRIQAAMSSITTVNKAGGVPVAIQPSDVVYGTYDSASNSIAAATTGVKAVQLRARRDATLNGVMLTTLGRVLGINTLHASSQSAATLSALSTLPAGYGEIPVGISSYWFETHSCENDRTIRFYPTGSMEGCAGWHTFTEWPASASRLGNILEGLEEHTYTSPEMIAGTTYFNFTGGTVASRFPDMKSLYDSRKDASGNWYVTVPVYKDNSCANPNGSIQIVGFARARIYGVQTAPSNTMLAEVQCSVVDFGSGAGNGGDYGTLYGMPGMVQ